VGELETVVGAAVGACDGVWDDMLGGAESNWVGAVEGSKVSATVGVSVGNSVGEDVASTVGAAVGLLVGLLVGLTVSGPLVGLFVGIIDGWTVGAGVASLSSLSSSLATSSKRSSSSAVISSSFNCRMRFADLPRNVVVAEDTKVRQNIHNSNKGAVLVCMVNGRLIKYNSDSNHKE
jgi:hypothetical protein